MQYRVRTFTGLTSSSSSRQRIDKEVENWLTQHGQDGYEIHSIERMNEGKLVFVVMVKYE